MSEEALIRFLPALVAGGVAWGAVKQGLNGTQETIKHLSRVLDRVGQKVDAHGEKLAALEADKEHIKDMLRTVEKRSSSR
ncbi:MAG: hypothetical protein EBV86_02615 [Marivivens sp.]|nr:hypothetical protein [Marivivens sp.]